MATPSVLVQEHPCRICGRPSTSWCSRCHGASYCTQEHLNEDWLTHRTTCIPFPLVLQRLCRGIGVASGPARPEDLRNTLGYLFLPSEDHGHPITIEYILSGDTEDARECRPVPSLSALFSECAGPPTELVITASLSGARVYYPLSVWYCPSYTTASHAGGVLFPKNKAIFNLAAERAAWHAVRPSGGNVSGVGAWWALWCGPIVVLKYGGSGCTEFVDMAHDDLAHFLAYLLGHHAVDT
ncbi:hypothetical protein C8Q80DRAFT_441872 [Daedaleopsis nitida]|nr:hypothetical protein C8Q80DRAFT_441872 [Daedaleopsis nitida]